MSSIRPTDNKYIFIVSYTNKDKRPHVVGYYKTKDWSSIYQMQCIDEDEPFNENMDTDKQIKVNKEGNSNVYWVFEDNKVEICFEIYPNNEYKLYNGNYDDEDCYVFDRNDYEVREYFSK